MTKARLKHDLHIFTAFCVEWYSFWTHRGLGVQPAETGRLCVRSGGLQLFMAHWSCIGAEAGANGEGSPKQTSSSDGRLANGYFSSNFEWVVS